MPSEAEVFLSHLNATQSPATTAPLASPFQVATPVQIRYLQERIRAVRHEIRHLREGQEQIHRENQSLREQLAKLTLENHHLADEFRRVQELAHNAHCYLGEIMASWNWRLVNRIHRVWHGFTRGLKRRRATGVEP
jgi:FtsZ-binding cell division protein ZapB